MQWRLQLVHPRALALELLLQPLPRVAAPAIWDIAVQVPSGLLRPSSSSQRRTPERKGVPDFDLMQNAHSPVASIQGQLLQSFPRPVSWQCILLPPFPFWCVRHAFLYPFIARTGELLEDLMLIHSFL